MIRFILEVLFVTVWMVLSLIFFPVIFIAGLFSKKAKDRMAFHMIRFAFKAIAFIAGAKTEVSGLENVPEDKAVLFVSNHRGFFDIILGYSIVKGPTGFVAKKDFEKIPFLHLWMKWIKCLFLDRSNIRAGMETIKQGISYIESGISMWICPEGGRNRGEEGSLLPFHEGSLRMADKSGALVVPVAFTHTYEILEKDFPRVKKTRVGIRIGKPVNLKDLDKETRKQSGAYVRGLIDEMLQDMLKEEKLHSSQS